MSRRNLVLAALAAAAWLAVLAVERPWRGDAHARTAAAVRPLFPDFERRRDEVRRIEVRSAGERTLLEWRADRWWVAEKEHPASLRKLVQVVDSVARLDTRDEVASDPRNHSQYGVAAGEGVRLTFADADGGVLADLIVGQMRRQDVTAGREPVLEFYLRRADRAAVYLSGEAIAPSASPIAWCERRFFAAIAPGEIESVRREDFASGLAWRIERDGEGGWRLLEPEPVRAADAFAGDSMERTLLDLEAADVAGRAGDPAEDAARCGFPADRFHVAARGATLRFELGRPAAEGTRWLRVDGLPYLYTIRDFDVSQLRQTVADMLPQESE